MMKLNSRLRERLLTRQNVILLCLVILLFIYYIKGRIAIGFINMMQWMDGAGLDQNVYTDGSLDTIIKTRVAQKYTIMSVSMVEKKSFYYILYIPVCALAWRRLGYEPLVMIVKNNSTQLDQLTQKTVDYLEAMSVRVVYVPAPQNREKQVAMLARLFVGVLPDSIVADDDLILTSDTDFIPINKKYFTFLNTDAITLLDARNKKFTYKGKPYDMPEILIPYIGMRKRQWRAVMRLNKNTDRLDGETIMRKVKEIHGEDSFTDNSGIQRGNHFWFLDQRTVTIAVNEYCNATPGVRIHRYPYTGLRLDRETKFLWYDMLHAFDQITDVHMFHSDSFEYRSWTWDLLRKIFSTNTLSFLEKYFNEFESLAK